MDLAGRGQDGSSLVFGAKQALLYPLGHAIILIMVRLANTLLEGSGNGSTWATACWPMHSCAFWEAEQLQLLKIEQGPGDRCNQYPGRNKIKGVHVAVQAVPYGSTGGPDGMNKGMWHV